MQILPSFPNGFCWRILIGFGLLEVTLGAVYGFTISPSPVLPAFEIAFILASVQIFTVWRSIPFLADSMATLAYMALFGFVLGPLSYIVAALNLPLVDEQLAAVDSLVFFDWRALMHFTATHRWAAESFLWLYNHFTYQMYFAILWLGMTRQYGRLRELFTAVTLATAAAVTLGGLLPAAGAYTHWHVAPSEFGFLGSNTGTPYMHDFLAVRDGTLRVVNMGHLEGIVQFPSYHTMVAVLSGWALIRERWIGIPFALLSALIVLTTLPIGGHHLADLMAGAAICGVTVAIGKHVEATEIRPAVATGPPVDLMTAPVALWAMVRPIVDRWRPAAP